MSRVMMMFRSWTSPDGVQMTPGLVDRDTYPDIPEECFWHRAPAEFEVKMLRADNARLRAALVHARTELRTARESGDGRRWLFHTIDPCLTHINDALGDPDEHELDDYFMPGEVK